MPVLKVRYFRYCSWFVEIEPAFQFNRGILGIRYWLGLCINRNGSLAEGLDYCSDWKVGKDGAAEVIVKE
jgi:hypothetical protein